MFKLLREYFFILMCLWWVNAPHKLVYLILSPPSVALFGEGRSLAGGSASLGGQALTWVLVLMIA